MTPFIPDINYNTDCIRISEITHNNILNIEINYNIRLNRIVVHFINGQYFYISSPDINHLSILQVIHGLGYGNDIINVVWTPDGRTAEILNSLVKDCKFNKISINSRIEASDMDCDSPIDAMLEQDICNINPDIPADPIELQ